MAVLLTGRNAGYTHNSIKLNLKRTSPLYSLLLATVGVTAALTRLQSHVQKRSSEMTSQR